MKSFLRILLCLVFLTLFSSLSIYAQLNIQAIDVSGDSISKGFNAGNSAPCSNGDQENYNWITSITNSGNSCSSGSENVFSVVERLACDSGTNILAPNPNHAASGARMLSDFVNQSNNIKTYLSAQNGQRLAAVFLGHNDVCSGNATKTNTSCTSSDLEPSNYCRTKNDSFEREFRKGLDILMTTPNTRIAVSSPVRVSQLCNFGSKTNCQLSGSCSFLWGLVNICASVTKDCSDTRIIDGYNTMKGFRDILKRVTEEYAAIPIGGSSQVLVIGGQTVGGAIKASGTDLIYSDAAWNYKFNSNQLSCCDCFHPSPTGQNSLARFAKVGLTCNRLNPCCKETGDALTDGKCAVTEKKQKFYRGLL
jgi:hypothetical protein